MRSFELQLLKDAQENEGIFSVQADNRESYEGFALVENGLARLRDRGAVEWLQSIPNGLNGYCDYTKIQVRVTAAGEDLLDELEDDDWEGDDWNEEE